MKLRKFLYGLTLMLGCLVFAACVNDEEGPCLSDGETRVLFVLSLEENTKAVTRAGQETWNNYNPKETGVEYDNYIDLDNVQVLLFNENGSFAGKLTDLTYSQTAANTYQFIGVAPSDLSSGGYKFVVLANCQTVTPESITSLGTLAYESASIDYIPMWGTKGVSDETTLTVQAGKRQSIGSISLLRAMSKVTVKLEAKEGASGDPLRGYSIQKAVLSNYNKSGYVVPTGYDTALETKELNLDACMHVNASPDTDKEFAVAATGDKELTFYLPEYDNVNADSPAVLTVYLTKTVGEGESATTINFNAPIRFCDYYTSGDNQGKPDTSKPYNIIRNHNYRFQIYSVSDDGALYVNPTVAEWIDATPLKYKIDMSTSMRLFDSWLYRYDTDGNYTNWNESHMVVSSGRGTATEAELVAGRPLRSPQIQLVTSASAGSFELYVDNDKFEIIQAVKNDVGVVTSYVASTNGTLAISNGMDRYTYFYIVPKDDATFGAEDSVVAKVFLYYNDPALGQQEVTFNNSSLPGYSDDSAEIWAYYVPAEQYDAGKIDDDNAFRKMYYQDANHPLEFVD